MKHSISNIAWKPKESEKIYKLLQEKGINGLEIAPGLFVKNNNPYETDKKTLIVLKNRIESYDINIISMQAILYGTKGLHLFTNKNMRDSLLEYIKKSIDFASTLGIKNIVFGSPKNRIVPDNMNSDKISSIAINFFKEIGDYAFKKDTCIGFEANPIEYGGNWMVATLQANELINNVDSKGFKLNFDTGTMIMNNEKENIIKEVFPNINHIHISEPFLKPVPQSKKMHIKIANKLKSIGYKGYVSVEMKAVNHDSNYTYVKKALDFIKKVYN